MATLFFDTEFYENGKTIELISIGIVSADGREYYAETEEAPSLAVASEWLQENVYPSLSLDDLKSRKQIADEILTFVGPAPKFWAYYCSYDWVVLAQLYGRMIDLPAGWPMYCNDLRQELSRLGTNRVPMPFQLEGKHNALFDARWNRDLYNAMRSISDK